MYYPRSNVYVELMQITLSAVRILLWTYLSTFPCITLDITQARSVPHKELSWTKAVGCIWRLLAPCQPSLQRAFRVHGSEGSCPHAAPHRQAYYGRRADNVSHGPLTSMHGGHLEHFLLGWICVNFLYLLFHVKYAVLVSNFTSTVEAFGYVNHVSYM